MTKRPDFVPSADGPIFEPAPAGKTTVTRGPLAGLVYPHPESLATAEADHDVAGGEISRLADEHDLELVETGENPVAAIRAAEASDAHYGAGA